MRKALALTLSIALVGCGTTPSPQENAQKYADETIAKRQGLHALQYGQSIDKVHEHLLQSYRPVMDFELNSHLYSVDAFSSIQFHHHGNRDFYALYEDNKLVAVVPDDQVKIRSGSDMMDHYYKMAPFGDNGGCDRYSSDRFLQRLVNNFQTKKVTLGQNALVRSEEDIAAYISYESTENGKLITGADAAELAIMSPFYVLFGPAAVAVGLMGAPISVPYMILADKDKKKNEANMPLRTAEIRSIPLGLSVDASERVDANILLKRKIASLKSTCSASIYPVIDTDMKYDVTFFAKNDRTFMRLYQEHESIWY